MMVDNKYMRRALEIARKGLPYAMPNPMVGAVIVGADGSVIGEGYHRRCGEAHAEVNAIADYDRRYACRGTDAPKLTEATMYVTLEPCAHYGRTGPCAQLIIDRQIPRVVVGCRDPFEKVDGKGIEMLREAGIEVTVGVMEEECRRLNAIFFTAHTQHRPFVILKWAQSADGYIDRKRTPQESPAKISSPLTQVLTHQLRAICDAILVGSETVIRDNPGLDTRLWPGQSPQPIVIDIRHRVTGDYKILKHNPIIVDRPQSVGQLLEGLYGDGVTSLLVEGGAATLQAFIDAGLWDIARVETNNRSMGIDGMVKAPTLSVSTPMKEARYGEQIVKYYSENSLVDVKNL